MLERFKGWWSRTEARRKHLVSEYGNLAIVLYLLISVANVAIVYVMLRQGFEIEGAAGQAATLGVAWAAAKAFIPARIALLVVLTPVVAEAARARGMLPALPPSTPPSTTTPSSE